MKKRFIFGLLGILSASTLLMVGCGDDGDSSTSSSVDTPSSSVEEVKTVVDITDAMLTMDCFETCALTVETKNADAVVWESSDPGIVSVDANGVLQANVKEGSVTITAKCGSVSDVCQVTVLRKRGLPTFAVETNLSILKGTSYTITGSLTYNGVDVSAYATYGFNANEEGSTVASATTEANSWTFVANETGDTQFTVYATIFGQTYTETVNVSVQEADIVYLLKDAVLNGDVSELCVRKGLQEYASMYTSNVEIYDKGVRVPNESLTWTISNTNVVEIGQDGKLMGKKEGVATLSTTYKDTPISAQVRVVKDRQYITAEGVQDVDLNVDISAVVTEKQGAANLNGVRTFTANPMQFVNLTLGEEGVNYGNLINVTLDGEPLDASIFEFANGKVKTMASFFGTDTYGEKTFVFESELDDIIYNFTVKTLMITKVISNIQDYRAYVPTIWKGDVNVGYYALGADIDLLGYGIGSHYATDFDYSHGFRGTLDGRGYAIKNCKPDNYGLMSQIGSGGVIKNLVLENLLYVGSGAGSTSRAILSRAMGGATVENVTINLSADSTPENGSLSGAGRGGLLTHSTKNNVYKNVTIVGQNHEIFCLIGVDEGSSVYENVVVKDAIVTNCTTKQIALFEGISLAGKMVKVEGLTQNGGVYQYSIGKPFNPAKHITIYVDGKKAEAKDLQWEFDEEIVAFEEGNIVAVSEGTTLATVSYEGIEIEILFIAQVYERVLIRSNAPAKDVDLDLTSTYDATDNKTIFTVNETTTGSVSFEVESGKDYGEIISAKVDETIIDESKFTYANGTFTFYTSAFGVENYGEKMLIIEMYKGDTVYVFETKVLLITKVLSSKIEMEQSLVVKKAGHMVDGYYVLDNDVNFEGQAMNNVLWVNDWDHKTGFVATLDGRGHKLLNYKSSRAGFLAQVSEGAVIKNLTFEGVLRSEHNDVVLARGMGGATIENVTITFAASADLEIWNDSDSANKTTGIIAYGTKACKYVNLTINAPGKKIYEVFTRENDTRTTYENVVINAKEIVNYYASVTVTPIGITFNVVNA